MTHEIEAQWMGKMQFNALVDGHTIVMDAPERVGGENNGPIPKPFILTALSGCTGMDVVALLRKAKKVISSFEIKISGEISKTSPIIYTSIHIVYLFKGAQDSLEASLKAVSDSQEKYCGVSNMLKKIMPVTWEIIYNDVKVFSNQMTQLNNINV